MILQSGKNRLQIDIVGYEFPDIDVASAHETDANWLYISISAESADGAWRKTDPCMLTEDVLSLAQWLRDISIGVNEKSNCRFLEPLLEYDVVQREGKAVVVRVQFRHGARPPWLTRQQVEEDPYTLVFSLAPSVLETAAADLEEQLQRFPERVRP